MQLCIVPKHRLVYPLAEKEIMANVSKVIFPQNDNKRAISARDFSRAQCDLPANGFVFCCFNNNFKM